MLPRTPTKPRTFGPNRSAGCGPPYWSTGGDTKHGIGLVPYPLPSLPELALQGSARERREAVTIRWGSAPLNVDAFMLSRRALSEASSTIDNWGIRHLARGYLPLLHTDCIDGLWKQCDSLHISATTRTRDPKTPYKGRLSPRLQVV
ncbi:hypothetical protein BV20DRAFT_964497 [Pilatotrama ljubarskyi]|nr:hypothetical protein BV20DRAFT_964497 [Pilatotrama ljubarskyi]